MNEENKFLCNICGEAFNSDCSLSEHETIHEDESSVFLDGEMCGSICIVKEENLHCCGNCGTETPQHVENSECGNSLDNSPVPSSSHASSDVVSHKCRKCLSLFDDLILLNEHQCTNQSNEKMPHVCDVCFKSFAKVTGLNAHKYSHVGEKGFRCNNCHILFNRRLLLKQHLCTRDPLFKCTICSKSFEAVSELQLHSTTHDRENSLSKCEICLKTFYSKKYLGIHKRIVHDGIKLFKCNICFKSFGRKCDLRSHSSVHRKEKPEVCTSCLKSFKTKRQLNLHSQIHNKNFKWHKCHLCSKSFLRKFHLKEHFLTHTREKAHKGKKKCDKCSQAFSKKSDLYKHLRSHVSKVQCQKCPKLFNSKMALERHLEMHLKSNPYKCRICFQTFAFKEEWTTHLNDSHDDGQI